MEDFLYATPSLQKLTFNPQYVLIHSNKNPSTTTIIASRSRPIRDRQSRVHRTTQTPS